MRKRVSRGFPDEFIEQVKSQNNIVSVLSKYLRLDRKGKNYWACCPFHNEKTPSFAVNESEGYYHCFGCGETGDVIKFLEKYDGLSFYEAVKKLAENAGLTVPEGYDSQKEIEALREKEKVLKALNFAKNYYEECLKKDKDKASNYVLKREFTPEIIKYFAIGYSPDWQGLIENLKGKGVSLQTMKQAGLIEENSKGNFYDVFATRITFPIFNSLGDTIGFTARSLEKNPEFAKYRNSTQTIVFDKSKTIYNLHTIRELKKSQSNIDYIIICEGTIDVIAMFKAGFKNTVACMGTAITLFHARELKKYSDKVVLCLDGDGAGQRAMYKAIDILNDGGLEVRVAVLKDKLDPDEYLKKYGGESLKETIDNACDGVEYKINSLEGQYNLNDNFEKNKFVNQVLELLSHLKTNAEKEIYLKLLAKKANMSIDILRRDLDSGVSKESESDNNSEQQTSPLDVRLQGIVKAVRFVLASIIHKEEYSFVAFSKNLYFKNKTYQKLYDFAKNCYENNKTYTISSLFDYFDCENNKDVEEIIGFNFNEIGDKKEEYFKECLRRLEEESLKVYQENLLEQFKTERDLDARRQIAMKLSQIAKEIKNGDRK